MNEVGFSVVGLGMGSARAKTIVQTQGARLVSVIDLIEEKAQRVAQEHGCKAHYRIDDALEDDEVDVMLIMAPSGMHGDLVVQSLEAGKHAITTKPMEVTVEKCDAMIQAQRQSGKLLGVDYAMRFTDINAQIKYAIDSGLLGKPILGEARLKWYRSQEYYDKGGWRGTWKMDGGGALANQTVHLVDLLRWFMGKPKSVTGRYYIMNHEIETEDLGMAIIEFDNGAVGTILGTTTFPQSHYYGMEIHGSEGAALTTQNPDGEWVFLEGLEDRANQLQRATPYQSTIENMVAAVRDGEALVCSGEDGRASQVLLSAVYESARQGGIPIALNARA